MRSGGGFEGEGLVALGDPCGVGGGALLTMSGRGVAA
jgi:hypothetical protein